MTGSYSGRFSLKSICMLLCVLIGMSFALQFVEVQDVHAADYSFWTWSSRDDECSFGFNFWGLTSGTKVKMTFSVSKSEFYVASKSSGITVDSASDGTLVISLTPKNNKDYNVTLDGYELTANSVKVSKVKYTEPPTNTPVPTNTNTVNWTGLSPISSKSFPMEVSPSPSRDGLIS